MNAQHLVLLQKAKTGESKAGHKYTRRRKNAKGEWVYKYTYEQGVRESLAAGTYSEDMDAKIRELERRAAAQEIADANARREADTGRYERSAQRKNKRTAAKLPLLAGAGILDQVVKPATAESQKDLVVGRVEGLRDRMARRAVLHGAKASAFRQIIGDADPTALAEGDAFIKRNHFEDDSTRMADYWRTRAKKLGLDDLIKEIDEEIRDPNEKPATPTPVAFGSTAAIRRYGTVGRGRIVSKTPRPRMKRKSLGSLATLAKARKGETIAGHKYTGRVPDGRGGWRYEYEKISHVDHHTVADAMAYGSAGINTNDAGLDHALKGLKAHMTEAGRVAGPDAMKPWQRLHSVAYGLAHNVNTGRLPGAVGMYAAKARGKDLARLIESIANDPDFERITDIPTILLRRFDTVEKRQKLMDEVTAWESARSRRSAPKPKTARIRQEKPKHAAAPEQDDMAAMLAELDAAIAAYEKAGKKSRAGTVADTLRKAHKGETVAGHKYKARHSDGKGGWIYEYDDKESWRTQYVEQGSMFDLAEAPAKSPYALRSEYNRPKPVPEKPREYVVKRWDRSAQRYDKVRVKKLEKYDDYYDPEIGGWKTYWGEEGDEQAAKKPPKGKAARVMQYTEVDALRRAMIDGTGMGDYASPSSASSDQRTSVKKKLVEAIGARLLKRVRRDPELQRCVDWLRAQPEGTKIRGWLLDRWQRPNIDDPDERDLLAFTAGVVKTWASTSGDSDSWAITLQSLVADEFKVKDYAWDHLEANLGPVAPDEAWYKYSNRKEFEDYRANLGPLARAFARAQYEETQAWFKQQGITHVSVFRGMAFNQQSNPYPAATLAPDEVEIQLQPQSSFSVQIETAAQAFASEEFQKGGDIGFVCGVRVPVEKVLSTSRTGVGCLTEGEITLVGGKYKAFVVNSAQLKADPEHFFKYAVDAGHMDLPDWKK